jgi:hypothetical protein
MEWGVNKLSAVLKLETLFLFRMPSRRDLNYPRLPPVPTRFALSTGRQR